MRQSLGWAKSAFLHAEKVSSRFAETRFAETLTLTLTLNPNFGESGFGKTGFGESGLNRGEDHVAWPTSAQQLSAKISR